MNKSAIGSVILEYLGSGAVPLRVEYPCRLSGSPHPDDVK